MPLHQPLEQQEVTSFSEMVNQKTPKENVQRKIQVIDTIAQPKRHAKNRGISATTINKISNQHQNTQETQQRPVKSVPVLTQISFPMQQVASMASSTTSSNRKENQRSLAHPASKKSQTGSTVRGNGARKVSSTRPIFTRVAQLPTVLKPEGKENWGNGFPHQLVYTQETQQKPARLVQVLPPVSFPMHQVSSLASSTTSSNRMENQRTAAHPANKKNQTLAAKSEPDSTIKPKLTCEKITDEMMYLVKKQCGKHSKNAMANMLKVSKTTLCSKINKQKITFLKHQGHCHFCELIKIKVIDSQKPGPKEKPIFTDFQKLTQLSTVSKPEVIENGFPKPAYSYHLLIALALKNSSTGRMTVKEIYKFMSEHFLYFKNAPNKGNLLRGIVIWSCAA